MADGPRKKQLDFDGNPDHVTLCLGLWLGLTLHLSFTVMHIKIVLQLGCGQVTPRNSGYALHGFV